MSRQRLRESTVKWDVALTNESFALKILKIVEIKSILNKAKFVKVKVCDKIRNFIKENFVDGLKYFEKKNKVKVEIIADNSLIIPDYKIELQNKSKKVLEKIEDISKLKNLSEQILQDNASSKKIKYKKITLKKKYFIKKNILKRLNNTFYR